jgi:hypothetical protein
MKAETVLVAEVKTLDVERARSLLRLIDKSDRDNLQRALECGEILERQHAQHGKHGKWMDWVKENYPIPGCSPERVVNRTNELRRVFKSKAEIEERGIDTFTKALAFVTKVRADRKAAKEAAAQAQRLIDDELPDEPANFHEGGDDVLLDDNLPDADAGSDELGEQDVPREPEEGTEAEEAQSESSCEVDNSEPRHLDDNQNDGEMDADKDADDRSGPPTKKSPSSSPRRGVPTLQEDIFEWFRNTHRLLEQRVKLCDTVDDLKSALRSIKGAPTNCLLTIMDDVLEWFQDDGQGRDR